MGLSVRVVIAAGLLLTGGVIVLPPQNVELISVRADGSQANAESRYAAVSGDGRYVAFASKGALDPPSHDGVFSVYVRDRQQPGRTLAVSRSGVDPAISANGRYVAFSQTGPGRPVVVVCDRDPDGDGELDEPLPSGPPDLLYTTIPGDPAAADARPSISADAGTIAWTRQAPGDSRTMVATLPMDTAGRLRPPVGVRELLPEVPGAEGGSAPPQVSADGKSVLVPVCLVFCGSSFRAMRDALYVADLPSGRMSRVDKSGNALKGAISGDGRKVAFVDDATLTVAHNGVATAVPTVARPVLPALSADGRYLAAVLADPHGTVMLRDIIVDEQRAAAGLPRLPDVHAATRSCGATCAPVPYGDSVSLSADGSVVAFDSVAEDLTVNDHNQQPDVFARPFRPEALADPVDFGTSVQRSVTVRHHGFGPLRIHDVRAGGAFTVDLVKNCVGAVVHETGECVVEVHYGPVGPGPKSGELVVTTNTGVLRVPMRGGTPVQALAAAPAEVVFAEHLTRTASPPATVVLHSSGTAPVTVRDLSLAAGPGLYSQDYQIDRGCVGAVLRPGMTCAVSIVSVPQGSGGRPGALRIVSDIPGDATAVRLRSTGTQPSLAVVPPVTRGGRVVVVTGSGYPPGYVLPLTGPVAAPVIQADPAGRFAVPMVVLRHGAPGVNPLRVSGPPGTDVTAEAALLITNGTYQPPGFTLRR